MTCQSWGILVNGIRRNVVMIKYIVFACFCLGACQGSQPGAPDPLSSKEREDIQQYWFQGKAELNRYELEQARYGALHKGYAVLVFVTEDFLTDKHVKLESKWRPEATPILKLNFVKKFLTGIYDYSMMYSVFTPVKMHHFPRSLKLTSTNQEWCGHTFLQMNLREGAYQVEGRSYFEKEADENYEIAGVHLEDEVWTKLRLSPELLPEGAVPMVPGVMASRLRHRKLEVETAQASFEANVAGFPGENLRAYRLKYADSGRTLRIVFESQFPYAIVGWEETYEDRGVELTSKAVRTHVALSEYWKQNSPDDLPLREILGLDTKTH